MPLNLSAIPEPREPISACWGKAQFASPRLAEKVAKRMSKAKSVRLVVYRCPFCAGAWHVGRNLKGGG